MDLHITEISL